MKWKWGKENKRYQAEITWKNLVVQRNFPVLNRWFLFYYVLF